MTDCRSEKVRAFEQQALAHRGVLYRFGVRLTGNAADADDLVQETYLKAYRFWDKYDQGTNVRAWLCRIMKNSFINLYRSKSRRPEMVDYSEIVKPTSVYHIAADAVEHQEPVPESHLDDKVSSAVSDLREMFRTVVILSDIEGFTYEEIARRVGCPLGTVRSRLHRGRTLLHSALYDYARERGYIRSREVTIEGLQLEPISTMDAEAFVESRHRD
jgi:RNA polymerase sigma-70 factor (ECF subfamily)